MALGCSPGLTHQPDKEFQTFDKRAESSKSMVVTAHPLATEAGLEILERGGNATDAAISAALVLSVVEPMMSGLGGSGSMVIWNSEKHHADYLDYYAQFGLDPDYSLHFDMDDPDTDVNRERYIAIPGMISGMFEAHYKYGSLEWKELFEHAIHHAKNGFTVHRLLGKIIGEHEDNLTYSTESASLFYPEGEPIRAGDLLVQKDLAELLISISEQGPSAFYLGPMIDSLLEKIQTKGSTLTHSDFESYNSRWRGALSGTYRGRTVYTAPPPLGGPEVLMALNMFKPFDLTDKGLPYQSGKALSLFTDIFRISMVDRWRWTGDHLFTPLPTAGLISKAYAAHRSAAIGGEAPYFIAAGNPWRYQNEYEIPEKPAFDPFEEPAFPQSSKESATSAMDSESLESHTTHLSIVDAKGNAVSMTNTLGLYFGSAVFTHGVFFNSTNRNARLVEPNIRIPNRTAHSSTAPTILTSQNGVEMVVGSPGSGRIPVNVVSMIIYTIDFGLDPYEAIRMPRIFPHRTEPVLNVEGGFEADALRHLSLRGYEIRSRDPMDMYFGGVNMILKNSDGTLIGVADPRRDGLPKGQ